MGGGHDHGHGPPYVIPNYKTYKVENVAELVALRRILKSEGLSDPWLRNEVWKYGTTPRREIVMKGMFRGFKYGLVAALITTAFTYYFDYQESQQRGSGGHHGPPKH